MRVAAIDLGSNTFELLIADKAYNSIKPVLRKLTINRLGGNFNIKSRMLDERAIIRSLDVLKDYSGIARENGVDKIRAVATSVVRSSVNSGDFLRRVFMETGIEVEIISGNEESMLSSLGVVKCTKPVSKYCVIVDIGGGSTELTVYNNLKLISSCSLELGVVNISENILNKPLADADSIQCAKEHISRKLNPVIYEILKKTDPDDLTAIFNAGTPITLACAVRGVEDYDPGKVNNKCIYKDDVQDFFDKVSSVTPEKRIELFPAVQKGREDLVVPGTLILLSVLNGLNLSSFRVSQAGILEGLIYRM